MKFLQNEQQIQDFIKTIQSCKGDVFLTDWRVDANGEPNIKINLKSGLSLYVGISDLISCNGDWYEIHCFNREDEVKLMKFFDELKRDRLKLHEKQK